MNRVTGGFDELGIVRDIGTKLAAFRIRFHKPFATEYLRSLRLPKPLARKRLLHSVLTIDLFERVRYRNGQ